MCCLLMLLLVPSRLWRWWLLRFLVKLLLVALLHSRPPRRPWLQRRAPTREGNIGLDSSPIRSGQGRQKPAWVAREVLRLAVFLRSCRAVAEAFNALHGRRATVSKSYVHELCRAHAQQLRLRRRRMRRLAPPAVPVGRAWSIDLTTVRAGSEPCLVFAAIDQASRRMLRCRHIAHKAVWSLLSELCAAIAEHGRPEAIRTDNEAMFTGWVWKAAMECFRIRRQRIQVACPWQNGRIERWFGTLKPVLARLSLPSPTALQGALDEFVLFYNHVRVHQGLGGLTPAQAWRGVSKADVRRRAGRGCWVQAFGGSLVGYHVRC
jgi:transposase InsO family protein